MEGSWGGLLQQLARKSLSEQATPGTSTAGMFGKAARQPASQLTFKVSPFSIFGTAIILVKTARCPGHPPPPPLPLSGRGPPSVAVYDGKRRQSGLSCFQRIAGASRAGGVATQHLRSGADAKRRRLPGIIVLRRRRPDAGHHPGADGAQAPPRQPPGACRPGGALGGHRRRASGGSRSHVPRRRGIPAGAGCAGLRTPAGGSEHRRRGGSGGQAAPGAPQGSAARSEG